jgi:hypothetical protein
VTGGDDYGAICGCEHAASEQLTHSVWHHLAEHLFLREHGLSVSSLKKNKIRIKTVINSYMPITLKKASDSDAPVVDKKGSCNSLAFT